MDKHELGAFLRSRRERLRPEDGAGRHRRDVRPTILALLERLPQTAAIVVSAAFEVLAWNDLAAALLEDFAALAPEDRNLARKAFLGPARPHSALYGISDAAEFRHHVVMELRSTLARYPSDPAPQGSRDADALALLNMLGTKGINATTPL